MNGPSAGLLNIKHFSRAVINGSNVLRNKNEEKANKSVVEMSKSADVFMSFNVILCERNTNIVVRHRTAPFQLISIEHNKLN